MRIKIFQAVSVSQAMVQVRDELGLDALILSTTTIRGGVEVTAALEIVDELDQLDGQPGSSCSSRVGEDVVGYSDARDDWYRRHNLSLEVMSAIREEPVQSAFARLFRFGDLPLVAGGPPLMLVGPPGVGKTLTVAKLATRLVLNGATPLIITADDQRAGAVEQLAAFTRLLGLTLIAAGGPEMLDRALSRQEGDSPILIDAPGLDLSESSQNSILSELILASRASTTLVLAAGIDPQEAIEVAASHVLLGSCHLLPTRLDRNGRLGGILAAARAGGMILTEAGIGTSVATGLERLSPDMLSARLHPEMTEIGQLLAAPAYTARDVIARHNETDALSAHIAAQPGAIRSLAREPTT